MRGRCNNKKGDLNSTDLFLRVSGYKRGGAITKSDITKVRMYEGCGLHDILRLCCVVLDLKISCDKMTYGMAKQWHLGISVCLPLNAWDFM